jgi:hypothetical protein
VDLPQIRKSKLATREIAVADEGVAFDAVALH